MASAAPSRKRRAENPPTGNNLTFQFDAENQPYLLFHARASGDAYKLSNFFECKVMLEGTMYPSAEHAYQASKLATPEHRSQFAVGGRFASWEAYKLFSKKEGSIWKAKSGIGIIAKMAIHKADKLRLVLLPDRTNDQRYLEDLWSRILTSKFQQSKDLMELLRATGNAKLVELALRGQVCKWNAKVDKDGHIVGENLMGKIMQTCRARFFTPDVGDESFTNAVNDDGC